MVYMKRLLVLLLALVALSSCSSAIKYISLESSFNELWAGRSHADVVNEYGAPDRVESDGLDGCILIYETFKEDLSKDYTHFYIGGDSRCYMVKSNLVEVDPDSVKRSKRVFWTTYGVGLGAAILLIVALAA